MRGLDEGFVVFASFAVALSLIGLAYALGRGSAATDCEMLGTFRSDDKVFTCWVKK